MITHPRIECPISFYGHPLLRYMLPLLFLGITACKSTENKQVAQDRSESKKPNIIYIMADDLGYGDLGVYGQQKIKTPRLDRMAKEGIRFTQHYAGSTVCMPSRASLLTAYHTGHGTVRGNPKWSFSNRVVDLAPEDVTVAEELKRAGYTTGVIGKWGLAEGGLESMPLKQGFDYFYGYRKHRTAHHYYPDTLYRGNNPLATGNDVHHKIGKYSHDEFTKDALDYIKKHKDTTFFLYLAYTIPHYELEVPEESKAPYKALNWEDKGRKLHSHIGGYQHDEDTNVTYAGMVSRMDGHVGQVLDLLKESGIEENTLVVFTSDNGHEFDRVFFNSNGDFKGHKRDLYDGGVRIPFIARWPGTIAPATTTDHIAAFWDFLPTACEIAGIEPTKKDIDGVSYLPTLLGNSKEQEKHDYLYWEFNEGRGPIQAIRKGNYKAVKYLKKPLELYNIVEDRGEENNLAESMPELADQMAEIMANARTENADFKLEFHPRVKKTK